MTPMVLGGETTGGLRAKPRGAPPSTTQFVDLVSDPAALSSDELGRTKVLGAEEGREENMDDPRRWKSP